MRLKSIGIGIVLASSCCLTGCVTPKSLVTTYDRKLSALLGKSWVMAPLPDSKLTPGSIIQIDPVAGHTNLVDIRWLGDLSSCGVPASAVVVKPGSVPGIGTNTSATLDSNVSGSLLKGIGAALSAAKSTVLTMTNASDDSLNLIMFNAWLSIPTNNALFNGTCHAIMTSANVYLIEEAFVVSKGSLALKNSAGANVSFTPPVGSSVLTAGFKSSVNSDGTLDISSPITFAVRRMRQVNNITWAALGSIDNSTAPNDVQILSGKTVRSITSN